MPDYTVRLTANEREFLAEAIRKQVATKRDLPFSRYCGKYQKTMPAKLKTARLNISQNEMTYLLFTLGGEYSTITRARTDKKAAKCHWSILKKIITLEPEKERNTDACP